MPIFAWNVPLVSLIFLKRSLVFPILVFSSVSLHYSSKKAFLSLLAILWHSAFSYCINILICWCNYFSSGQSLNCVQLFVTPWTARISNQSILKEISQIFIGRTDAEVETPILWPHDVKNWLPGKDPDAGKDWRQEEKRMTEDEMVGWRHWLIGHEFEQTPGVGDGEGGRACCSPWGRKELDMTKQLIWSDLIWSDLSTAVDTYSGYLVSPLGKSIILILLKHWK